MKKMYPDRLSYLKSDDIYGLEHEILIGQIVWNASGNSLLSSKHRRERREGGSNISNEAIVNMTVSRGPVVGNTIEVDIAHGLHKASIAIVGILCVEVI
ncbi:hypothetical protein DPMN_000983 [Dreissena polymorpha]|uniref:Uncharacterized protein n=1 Tax=Dreissena polymorpha TaxID=45954 RepID=A0A9D4RPZ5_DREPO|nr:hypothetical protein DPMN_000983 [Dreissena polymorpha]